MVAQGSTVLTVGVLGLIAVARYGFRFSMRRGSLARPYLAADGKVMKLLTSILGSLLGLNRSIPSGFRTRRLACFGREQGNCWVVDIPTDWGESDSEDASTRSRLRLFEGDRELGPAHSPHSDIRKEGGGRFAHWNGILYFSTTDNSSPSTNGRRYSVLLQSDTEYQREKERYVRQFGDDDDAIQRIVAHSLSRQGSVFHTLHSLRCFEDLFEHARMDLGASHVLEIGASPTLGLPMALAMMGARKVTANNVMPIRGVVDEAFLAMLHVLLSLRGAAQRSWREIVQPSGEARRWRIDPSLINICGNTSAADLPKDCAPVDYVFSVSVLEHIRQLPLVLDRVRGLMSPTAHFGHSIDLRDHTAFRDPLKYLRLTEEEFQRRYDEGHNRWRVSDYVSMIQGAGFSIDRITYAGGFPVNAEGNTDLWDFAEQGLGNIYVDDLDKVKPVLTDAERASLSPEYGKYSCAELSVMSMMVSGRR